MLGKYKVVGSLLAASALVAISATPLGAATTAAGGRFWDDDGNTHEANIEAIANAGVTLGCDSLGEKIIYCPNVVLNRAQMASFLARAPNLDPVASGPFTDLDGALTHAQNINAIAADGITLGCDSTGTLYCPYNTVTRAQMGSFLTRGLDYPAIAVAPRLDLSNFMTCSDLDCTGSGTYPANKLFSIRHGWIFSEDEADYDLVRTDVNTGFVLFMDLEDEFPSTAITSTFQTEPARYDTIDFPAGLSGEHGFEAQWLRLGEVTQTAIITIDFGG